MINQWRIWKIVSGNKISAAVIVVEITKAGKRGINERNKVEREIMTCLSKIFSLTNNNSTMKQEFTSKIGYLAETKGAEDILKERMPQTLQCDIERKENNFLKC